jgi:hypothetical protein
MRVGMEHLALQRDAGQAHRFDGDLDAHQCAHANVDLQRGGGPPQAIGNRGAGLAEPSLVEQLAHQQAHGRFGEAAFIGKPRTRESRTGAQQAQQDAAVHPLEQLLIADGHDPTPNLRTTSAPAFTCVPALFLQDACRR